MANELSGALMVPEHLNPTGIQVRMAGTAEEPLFCVADICELLGLGNTTQVVSRIEEEDRVQVNTLSQTKGNPNLWHVNESGLYAILLRSDKPAAKPFRQWVTREVLPCLRKHGCYPAPAQPAPQAVRLDAELHPAAIVPVSELRSMMDALRRLERRQAAQDVVERVPGVVEARQFIRELWPHCPDRTSQNIVRRLDQLYRDECGRPAPKLGYAPSAPLACEYEHMRLLFRAVTHFWREAHPDQGPRQPAVRPGRFLTA